MIQTSSFLKKNLFYFLKKKNNNFKPFSHEFLLKSKSNNINNNLRIRNISKINP